MDQKKNLRERKRVHDDDDEKKFETKRNKIVSVMQNHMLYV